jgi:hypothetical protein
MGLYRWLVREFSQELSWVSRDQNGESSSVMDDRASWELLSGFLVQITKIAYPDAWYDANGIITSASRVADSGKLLHLGRVEGNYG